MPFVFCEGMWGMPISFHLRISTVIEKESRRLKVAHFRYSMECRKTSQIPRVRIRATLE